MSNGYELVSKVVSFLKESGYPDASILTEYAIPNHDNHSMSWADIAIVEQKLSQPVALFELKALPFSRELCDRALNQINFYASRLPGSIRLYLVFAADNKCGFIILDVTTFKSVDEVERVYNMRRDEVPHIVSFENLVNGNFSERRSSEIKDREDRRDSLVRWRWAGIAILSGLFVRDYYHTDGELSWESLSVLCGAFVLWLLPYYDVISIKDIGLQRHHEDAQKSKD